MELDFAEAGVFGIDCHYIAPEIAAAYLMVEGDEAAFVENNTTHAVPRLLAKLEEQRLSPAQVRYIIITHVHLDHAGGTSALVKACPNAMVLAHPRAAKHVIDPSRLVESSIEVYGKERFESLYGLIEPVDEQRVRIMQDEEELDFGSRTLRFIYTRGHANHHFCIFDSKSNGIFTGDTFGMAYPTMQGGKAPFLYASTTPTDFDAPEARISLKKLADTGAERAFLTHFGVWDDMPEGQKQMARAIDAMEAVYKSGVRSGLDGDALQEHCANGVREFLTQGLGDRGLPIEGERDKLMQMDIDLNGMGLAFAATKTRRKQAQASQ